MHRLFSAARRALTLPALAGILALSACAGLGGPQTPAPPAPYPAGFVTVEDGRFLIDGEDYAFVGVNFWYGAYLGAEDGIGDLERLEAELDLLQDLGVTNLRVLGASEKGPLKDSLQVTFRDEGDAYNETLLKGLDVLLAEMAERDMKAVIYLGNFWEWSGGFGTYMAWTTGEYVDLNDPETPWPAFVLFNQQFYDNEAANSLFLDYVEALVTRTNSVTGTAYRDDPTIMAWQLTNEPRAGYSPAEGMNNLKGFYRWVDYTSAFIKALDPNHLISTGNEGWMGCAEYDPCFIEAHDSPDVDYLTFHLWPLNWGWFDPQDPGATWERTLQRADAYIDQHIAYAEALGKPIVIEEFGLPRDGGSIVPGEPARYRDLFLARVYGRIEENTGAGGPFMGSNVWSWGGYGRAQRESGKWADGDTSYVGDPPQEPQGLNSVFDTDTSTLAVMQAHARALGVFD